MTPTVTVKTLTIPTYSEQPYEKLPMFAETRVHQRSSGNPYPNAVVIKTRSPELTDRDYTAVILENDYLQLTVLPELGGRIFRALDKRTGYDFFYKQSVIKPALIGALGSWISGGVEFNFPYHHRPSTFLPTDFTTETEADGSVCVHLSEHDPFDRMKGMVTIRLRPESTVFETAARIYNRTPERHSFLWWENAAAPVNEDYHIFYPGDVGRVYFHYRRNATTWPYAKGVFNGHEFIEPTFISRHGDARFATSFFCDKSEQDFFGGYDANKECGVVHFANRHTSPGKKLFTWGYGQLAHSWEKALTDTDGAYAELMASSYSSNQPDFSWIEPYETKEFSQFWYPISKTGIPDCANKDFTLTFTDNGVRVSATKCIENCRFTAKRDGKTVWEQTFNANPTDIFDFTFDRTDCTFTITDTLRTLFDWTPVERKPLPETTIGDLPTPDECQTAEEAYLTGLHMMQYRDPKGSPELYFNRALTFDPNESRALLGIAECKIHRHDYAGAVEVLTAAEKRLTKLNRRPESGRMFWLFGLCHERLHEDKAAFERYWEAAVLSDTVVMAYTRIALLDLKFGNPEAALADADYALNRGVGNFTAATAKALALLKLDRRTEAVAVLDGILTADPLFHFARYVRTLTVGGDFFSMLHSSPTQTCIDVYTDLMSVGCETEAKALLTALTETGKADAVVYYLLGKKPDDSVAVGRTFPFRDCEREALEAATDDRAKYLLGCVYYHERRYDDAAKLWRTLDTAEARRATAVYDWRCGFKSEAVALLYEAVKENESEQLLWELAGNLNRLGRYDEVIALLTGRDYANMRDDLYLELVHACNQSKQYEKALSLLQEHTFIPCEGGEPAVTSRYLTAMLALAMKKDGEDRLSILREGQIIPENLGAGLWNDSPLMPLVYEEGMTLVSLGRNEEARKCFERVLSMQVDFFTDGQQPLLPVYQSLSLEALGLHAAAGKLAQETVEKFRKAMTVKDGGYFATTPFFNCYIDKAEEARKSRYSDLLAEAEKLLV